VESLYDGSHRPHWHPNQQTEEELAQIKKVLEPQQRIWVGVSAHGADRSTQLFEKPLHTQPRDEKYGYRAQETTKENVQTQAL
jgi:16S rRNA G1207 methylase RsmC